MLRIGVDVGGTFTDVVMIDEGTGEVRTAKVRSHRGDEAKGFWAALQSVDAPVSSDLQIVHGTTLAINALLERSGAACGLIVTKGFRDVLELARRDRPNTYGLTGQFDPIVPRRWRVEVTERIDAQGRVLTPLDEDEVRQAVAYLQSEGVESVAIAFLHAWANPVHEQQARDLVASLWPNHYITASHEVVPEIREFERSTTTALNAYLRPRVDRYLSGISGELKEAGSKRELLITQGNGGVAAAATTAEFPVKALMSGPAAGVTAAALIGRQAGIPNLVSFDMGGTSCDVALIVDGQPRLTGEKLMGFRLPVRSAMVDIHSVGSGGGSIAMATAAGTLQVGPRSAGSVPGPIVYGEGGEEPTVTDANFLLGRLDMSRIGDLRTPADREKVAEAMDRLVAKPLGLDPIEAAAAIVKIANQQMANAVRLVSLGSGHDPRDFGLLAFGGAGPLHASAIARELNFPVVIVPPLAGLVSALGCAVSDLRHDFAQTVNWRSDETTDAALREVLLAQKQQGLERLQREGYGESDVRFLYQADVQYDGQTHVLPVELGEAEKATVADVVTRFEDAFEKRFGMKLNRSVCRIVTVRTAVTASSGAVLPSGSDQADAGSVQTGQRSVYFEGHGWVDCPVYWRPSLQPGNTLEGPAILEQADTTILLEPGDRAEIDAYQNVLIKLPEGGR